MPVAELTLPMLGTQLPNHWIVVAVNRVSGDEAYVLALRKEVIHDGHPYCVWRLSLRDMATFHGIYCDSIGAAAAEFRKRSLMP